MASNRVRQLYQSDLVFVGPTGIAGGANQPATGALGAGAVWGNYLSVVSGANYLAELFRVTRVDDSWNRTLTNVNQIGQLAAIDRVTITQPTVNLTLSWIQNNFVNESLIGLTVIRSGSAQLLTCISGILNQTTEPLNYFVQTTPEGTDAINYLTGPGNQASYVVSFGNAYLESYTANGRINEFPSVDVSLRALNAQAQLVTGGVPVMTPAVYPGSGTNITGWAYILPTGYPSFNNVGVGFGNWQGISALRPGDIKFSLGLGAGQGFVDPSFHVQSYSLSLPFNREDFLQLGSKYAFAILPRFPIDVSLTVDALVSDLQTGSLVEIVNNNDSFNPSINITTPGTNNTVVFYQLSNAKLQDNTFSQSVGSTAKTVRMTFVTQIGGPQDTTNIVSMSGISVN